MPELADIKLMKETAVGELLKLKKAKKSDVIKSFVETDTLRVKLTTDEILAAGDALAEALSQSFEFEAELDEFKKHIKGKLAELENKIDASRKKVHDKWEYRKVDTVEVKNNTVGNVIKIRMDTSEIFDERKMTADERQGSLWDEEETED